MLRPAMGGSEGVAAEAGEGLDMLGLQKLKDMVAVTLACVEGVQA
jgi:hypothetical protein